MNRFQVGDEVKIHPKYNQIIEKICPGWGFGEDYQTVYGGKIGVIESIDDDEDRLPDEPYIQVKIMGRWGFFPYQVLQKKVELNGGKFFWLNTK